MATIRFYDVVLFVHIAAVMLAFGATFAYPLLIMSARRGRIEDLAALHRFQVVLTSRLIQPAMAVILAAGIYMVSDSDAWKLSDGWISATFAILIVLFGIVGAVFAPTERKMAALAERDLGAGGGGLSDEYKALERKMNIFGPIAGLLIMTAIFLMTTKPGA